MEVTGLGEMICSAGLGWEVPLHFLCLPGLKTHQPTGGNGPKLLNSLNSCSSWQEMLHLLQNESPSHTQVTAWTGEFDKGDFLAGSMNKPWGNYCVPAVPGRFGGCLVGSTGAEEFVVCSTFPSDFPKNSAHFSTLKAQLSVKLTCPCNISSNIKQNKTKSQLFAAKTIPLPNSFLHTN